MKINESSEHGDVAAHNLAAPSHEAAKKYFCPMCDAVESDTPGTCPKCGMALERNPTFREPKREIYTCPMPPQIE
jgi:P-type Cu+ transporter